MRADPLSALCPGAARYSIRRAACTHRRGGCARCDPFRQPSAVDVAVEAVRVSFRLLGGLARDLPPLHVLRLKAHCTE
jgi:hypothetical protein